MERQFVLALALFSLVLAGCGTDGGTTSEKEAMSRRAVDEKTVSMLIQSQRALKQGALRKALVLADSVVQRVPRLPDAHFQRGRVLSELKRFDEAEQAYKEVLSLDPEYQGVRYNLGNNAYRQQEYQKALTYYQEEQDRYPSPTNLVSVGKAYGAQGNPDSARHAYERALALDSTHAPAHARLGQLYEDEGNLEQALHHSRRALELDPDNVNYRYVVGAQLFRLGRSEEAIEPLKAVTEERPWHRGAHYNLGQALMRVGESKKAERYLAEADSLEKQEREIERLESVAQDQPADPARWRKLGEAYRKAGRLKDAREAYHVALYLNPRDPTLRDQVAQLSAELGDYEAAVAQYRTLVRQHPTFVEGWFNLGVVYARNGKTQKARKAWKRVLREDPTHQRAKNYLARLSKDS